MIYLDWGSEGGDPYWANVSLLIQDGANGDTLIQDRSSFASTVTATSDASWSNSHQVNGNNALLITSIGPGIPPFTSSGTGSRFSRASGEALTVECYVYIQTLRNYSVSLPIFWWTHSVGGSLAELRLGGNRAQLQLRQNSGVTDVFSDLSYNTLHFLQLTVIGDTYYLDVDGAQVGTGTFTAYNSVGTYNLYACAANTSSSIGVNQVWISPFRWTKGVARARGSVPSTSFPTN